MAPPGEPDPAETAGRYGAETTVPDWRERLVCSQCRIGGSPAPPLARSEVFAELKWEKRCPTSDTARIRSHLSDNSSGLRRVSYPPAPTPPCEDFSLCNLSAAGLRLSAVHAFGIVHRRTYRPPSCSATSSFSTPSIPRGRGTAASGLCTKVSEIFSGFHQTLRLVRMITKMV